MYGVPIIVVGSNYRPCDIIEINIKTPSNLDTYVQRWYIGTYGEGFHGYFNMQRGNDLEKI
jgi:hypothetical protein